METLALPDPFCVLAWTPTTTGPPGVAVTSDYAETFWLPIIGPTSLLLARKLVRSMPGAWEKAALGATLGVGRTPLDRSLARLVGYRLAVEHDEAFLLRETWPRLPSNLLARLPGDLRAREAEFAALCSVA